MDLNIRKITNHPPSQPKPSETNLYPTVSHCSTVFLRLVLVKPQCDLNKQVFFQSTAHSDNKLQVPFQSTAHSDNKLQVPFQSTTPSDNKLQVPFQSIAP